MNTLNELIRKELTHSDGPVLTSEQADDLVERIGNALRPRIDFELSDQRALLTERMVHAVQTVAEEDEGKLPPIKGEVSQQGAVSGEDDGEVVPIKNEVNDPEQERAQEVAEHWLAEFMGVMDSDSVIVDDLAQTLLCYRAECLDAIGIRGKLTEAQKFALERVMAECDERDPIELRKSKFDNSEDWHGNPSVPLEELRTAQRLANELEVSKQDETPSPDFALPSPTLDYTWILAVKRGLGHTRAACGQATPEGGHVVITSNNIVAREMMRPDLPIQAFGLDVAEYRLRGQRAPLVFDIEAVKKIVRDYEAQIDRQISLVTQVNERRTDLELEQQATEDRLEIVVRSLDKTIAFLDKDRGRAGWNQGQIADTLANAVRLIIGTTTQPVVTCECEKPRPGLYHEYDPIGWTCDVCGGFIPQENVKSS